MYNLNSNYGRQMADALPLGISGKVLVVGKVGVAHRDIISQLFKTDPNGVVRFFATVDAAVGSATANAGDTIVVLPGHTETVTSSSLTLDVAGINVVCLGHGSNRPTFSYGAAAATINVGADNITWKGGLFSAAFDNVAAAFTVGAGANFRLEGASFVDAADDEHFLSIVVTGATDNAADGLQVVDNEWLGLALAPDAFISILAAESHVRILNNRVNMAATNNVGHFLTIAAKVMTDIIVEGNRLVVVGATDATVGIFMTGSSTTNTGYLAHNFVTSLDTTTELITTAALALGMFENYYTGNKTASGKLWPAVDAA